MTGEMMAPVAVAEALARVKIRLANVPETLSGVPLPVSIVSESGRVAWSSLLSGGRERRIVAPLRTANRSEPERFVARTELPGGQYLDAPVAPPSSGDTGEALLDFRSLQRSASASDFDLQQSQDFGGAEAASANLPGAIERLNHTARLSPGFGVSMAQRVVGAAAARETTGSFDVGESGRGGADPEGGFAFPSAASGVDSPESTAPVRRGGAIVVLNYLRLDNTETSPWRLMSPELSSFSAENGFDTLLVRPVGQGGLTSLPSAVSSRIYTDNGPPWRPGLVRAQIFSAGINALIVWPALLNVPLPAGVSDALLILPDATPDVNPLAPPLTATATSGDARADALFSYIRGGALEIARQTGDTLLEQAEGFLMGKYHNPIAATVGAYVLLKLNNLARLDWVYNLAHDFPNLADGAIIYAWFLIYTGRRGEAQEWLHTALTRGLPLYTEGIRLLRDGLNLMEGVNRDDVALREDAAFARRLAGLANMESELTCLRLEPYLILQEAD